jgi:hypothetical protein
MPRLIITFSIRKGDLIGWCRILRMLETVGSSSKPAATEGRACGVAGSAAAAGCPGSQGRPPRRSRPSGRDLRRGDRRGPPGGSGSVGAALPEAIMGRQNRFRPERAESASWRRRQRRSTRRRSVCWRRCRSLEPVSALLEILDPQRFRRGVPVSPNTVGTSNMRTSSVWPRFSFRSVMKVINNGATESDCRSRQNEVYM